MNSHQDHSTNTQFENEKPLINYKRIWYRIIRYWYFVVFSLIITLAIAYIYNRYATRTYSVSASIIIKESEEAGQTAELLYNNPLVNAYRNFLNEPYIIKSYPLLQQVVDSLGISAVLYREGNIKTSELYQSIPLNFSGNKINDTYLKGNYDFKIINKDEFALKALFPKESDSIALRREQSYAGTFDEVLNVEGYSIFIQKTNKLDEHIGESFILSFQDGYELAVSYSDRLTIEWAEEGASLLKMKIQGTVINKEQDFLTKLIDLYTLRDLKSKREAASSSKKFIDQQLAFISDSLLLVEMQLERFKNKNTQIDLGVEAQRVLYKIDELEKTKTAYIIKENYYQYLFK